MGHEARVIAFRRMSDAIKAERRAIDAPGTTDRAALQARMEGWKMQVRTAERDLVSQSNFNAMGYARGRHGPDAYAAGQRYRSKERNVATLYSASIEVAQALGDLYVALRRDDGGGGMIDKDAEAALKGFEQGLGNLSKLAASHGAPPAYSLQGQEQILTASIRQLDRSTGGGGAPIVPGAGIVDAFTLILSCFALIKALRRRR